MYKVTNNSEYTVQALLSADGPVSLKPKDSLTISNPHSNFVKEIGRVSNFLSYVEVSGDEKAADDSDIVVDTETQHPNTLDKEPGTVIEGKALTPEEINHAAEDSQHHINDDVPEDAVVGANQDGSAPKTGEESNVAPKEVTDAELTIAGEDANEDADLKDGEDGVDQAKEGELYTAEELGATHWATLKSIAEANGINYVNKAEAIEAILAAGIKKS